MEDTIVKVDSVQNNGINNNNAEGIKRSSSYPAYDINKAFDFARRINEQFSTIAEVSREQIAAAFKMNPGSIVRDIATCVQFGFLDKNTAKGTYQLTPLFSDIFRPESVKEKKINFIRAFGTPPLYNELIKKFDNNVIPNELANTLIKNHNIRDKVAQNAADTFIQSGKDVGVINEGRFLKYKITISTLELQKTPIVQTEEEKEENDIATGTYTDSVLKLPSLAAQGDKKNINIPIHLTGNKVALFSYPEEITENDIKIVKHQLEGVLLRITLEQGENKGETEVSP